MDVPFALSSRRIAKSRSTSRGVSADVGSSRISVRAFPERARASSTIWRSAGDLCDIGAWMSKSSAKLRDEPPRLCIHGAVVEEDAPGFMPQEYVLSDIEIRHEPGILVDHGDTEPARVRGTGDRTGGTVDEDAAGIGPVHPGQDPHERRFTRPVLTHQRMDLAASAVEGHVVERLHAGKGLGYRLDGERCGICRVQENAHVCAAPALQRAGAADFR